MNPPRPRFSPSVLRRLVAVLDDPGDGFVALVRLAGLDPARDFRGAVLDGVDFGTDDLSGFDFSGADLRRSDLSRATGLDRIITDSTTLLPEHAPCPPADFSPREAYRMILTGRAPPVAWRPFITELSFSPSSFLNFYVPDRGGLRDLAPLSGLTALQYLDLTSTQVSDVSLLADLTSLRTLHLASTQVGNVSPLAGLTALRILNLWKTQVSDVSPLAGLTELQSLDLARTPVSDVSPLAGLTALLSFNLCNTKVSDLSPLRDLTALQGLSLVGTLVTDVSPLARLTALQSLDLRNTKVGDVSSLEPLEHLEIIGGPRRLRLAAAGEVTRVSLNASEIAALSEQDPATRNDGGYQGLLVDLQRKCDNATGKLDLSTRDRERIRRYAFHYGNGGWEGRLVAVFGRHLGPKLDR